MLLPVVNYGVSASQIIMNLTSVFKDLYCGDKYYIYKDKLNGKIYFNKIGNGAGGFVRINKNEVPDEILDKISKQLI